MNRYIDSFDWNCESKSIALELTNFRIFRYLVCMATLNFGTLCFSSILLQKHLSKVATTYMDQHSNDWNCTELDMFKIIINMQIMQTKIIRQNKKI